MYLFSANNILSVFIAAVLGVEVAAHLALASRTAATAMRLAAALLCVDAAWGFLAMPLSGLFYSLPMGEWLFHEFPRLAYAGFWGCLAWSALALATSAKTPEVPR